MKKQIVATKLIELFRLLTASSRLKFATDGVVQIVASGKKLITITSAGIITSVPEISDSIFDYQSSLADSFVSNEDLQRFVDTIGKSIYALDHMGFCYTAHSQKDELKRIKQAMRGGSFRLYEMTSTDLAKWYFIGDRQNWPDPMIELLPTLPNDDPELPYWMPHIHIDINTTLSADQLISFMKDIFGNSRSPIQMRDPEYGVYSVRLWLGTVAGINIDLDVSTNVRNMRYVKEHMLREI
jgi:hypothetical protein